MNLAGIVLIDHDIHCCLWLHGHYTPCKNCMCEGSIQSLDWTGGLDRWTGLVDWTSGLTRYAHRRGLALETKPKTLKTFA